MTRETKAKTRGFSKIKLLIVSVLLILGLLVLFGRYAWFAYAPNVNPSGKTIFLYIPEGADFEQVIDSLSLPGRLKNLAAFRRIAELKKYTNNIKPGRYRLKAGNNNLQLVNKLRSGKQDAIRLVFNNIRTLPQLAGKLARQLEADSLRFLEVITGEEIRVPGMNFTDENRISLFIPNTYEVYWNTAPVKIIRRMEKEYQSFWSPKRQEAAAAVGLNPLEVSILASIIEMETTRDDEKGLIAGVYLNRLARGMPLEADPTLVFALGDFSIQRVLLKDRLISSPYNTYLNRGLPPGPICAPSIASIDAVLNPARHAYLFFCARADFSGYHEFSKSLGQHLHFARAYQAALNQRDIKR